MTEPQLSLTADQAQRLCPGVPEGSNLSGEVQVSLVGVALSSRRRLVTIAW